MCFTRSVTTYLNVLTNTAIPVLHTRCSFMPLRQFPPNAVSIALSNRQIPLS